MGSDRDDNKNIEVRVELKYCEHCGGLWVRERGAGVVFCERCQPKVDDLPMRKKKPGRVRLPQWRLLHCTGRTVRTYVPIALDLLSEVLLDVGLLEREFAI